MELDYEEITIELKKKNKFIFLEDDLFRLFGLNKKEIKEFLKEGIDKGDIVRLPKGLFYLNIVDENKIKFETLVDGFFERTSYYIGLGYALNYWGFPNKDVERVVFTRRKNLDKLRLDFGETKIYFRYLDNKFFFGHIRVPTKPTRVNISDFEKTFLDLIIFLGDEVNFSVICDSLEFVKEKLNFRKFARYAIRTDNREIVQRVGYILDNYLKSDVADALREYVGKKKVLLNPKGGKNGEYNSRWHVLVNKGCG